LSDSLKVYQDYQHYLSTGTFERLGEVVDLEHFTEICLGLTPGWIVGFDQAYKYYQKNVLSAFSDIHATEQEVIEGDDVVVLLTFNEATHSGIFLGIPPTGRRFSFHVTTIAHLKEKRLTKRWIQIDLWGIYQQLNAFATEKAAI
jgi:predicted ester cyclase